MKIHIFTCILHLVRVYYQLTKWSTPRWLDGSVTVENCTGSAEVMRSNLIRPELLFVFRAFTSQLLKLCA